MKPRHIAIALALVVAATALLPAPSADDDRAAVAAETKAAAAVGVGPYDWAQWGGSPSRNNTPQGENIPTDWDIGKLDRETGEWSGQRNIKWVMPLGSQSYGNPVIANGKVYVGTNNGSGYVKRYAPTVDLGCLLCFNEEDGKFLWQHSSEKLPTGRVHDWPLQGICCSPLVEGDRLWFVTSRGEVACLDTEGFHDGENDGPYDGEKFTETDEADTVWVLNMMTQLGISQHNMCSCSVTAHGDVLFVCTSNGVDEGHENLPAPSAPSFIALDKRSGEVLWTDNSPGTNVVHGQWSSPSFGVLGGVPQVLFGGGDGYVYSFLAEATDDGRQELLWKFDCNPKDTKYSVSGKSTRNHIIGIPLIYDGLVYIAVGEDPEHGEGAGHMWCIDPTKRGDVSPHLVYNTADLSTPIPHKRMQAAVAEEGDVIRDNPNSAAVWHYATYDRNEDMKIKFDETMHRTMGTACIQDDLLFIPDLSGLVHCLDPHTGIPHWTHDMKADCWGSPLIVGGHVYIGDGDGDLSIFKLSADPEVAMSKVIVRKKEVLQPKVIGMANAVYSTPVVANNVLYIMNRTHLFAIAEEGE